MSNVFCQGASFTTCDSQARRQWMMATVGVGGALGLTALTPFVSSLMPSERANYAGAPVEVDIGKLAPGDMMIVEWRGKPVDTQSHPGNARRTEEGRTMLADQLRKTAATGLRHQRDPIAPPEMLVAVGFSTHLGCSPSTAFTGRCRTRRRLARRFLCPCHGSTFDFAGRVFQNKPAPTNLEVPPISTSAESRLVIGSDEQDKA